MCKWGLSQPDYACFMHCEALENTWRVSLVCHYPLSLQYSFQCSDMLSYCCIYICSLSVVHMYIHNNVYILTCLQSNEAPLTSYIPLALCYIVLLLFYGYRWCVDILGLSQPLRLSPMAILDLEMLTSQSGWMTWTAWAVRTSSLHVWPLLLGSTTVFIIRMLEFDATVSVYRRKRERKEKRGRGKWTSIFSCSQMVFQKSSFKC